ncbi:MAG: hypothetical protein ACI4UN_07250, partial [Muribaculaceae bacterium]
RVLKNKFLALCFRFAQILDKSGGISAECSKINFWHFAFDLHKFFVDLQEFSNLQKFLFRLL